MLDQTQSSIVDIPASFPAGQRWYVFSAEPAREMAADSEIRKLGFQTFTPCERRIRRVRNRRVEVDRPLFGGYGFVRFDINREAWGQIVNAKWVWDVLRMARVPVSVPDRVIDGLMVADRAGVFDHTRPPSAGMMVEITSGPFAGLLGKVKRARSSERMEVLVTWLNAEICADVPLASLREA